MNPRTLFFAALAVLPAFVIGPGAERALAGPRFHVTNNTGSHVTVNIFNGDDSACAIAAKHHKFSSGHTQSFGCEGNGKGRCKIDVRVGAGQVYACANSQWNTCDSNGITMEDGQKITIGASTTTPPVRGSYPCTIE